MNQATQNKLERLQREIEAIEFLLRSLMARVGTKKSQAILERTIEQAPGWELDFPKILPLFFYQHTHQFKRLLVAKKELQGMKAEAAARHNLATAPATTAK